jgi:hypothetical protein
LPLIVTHGWPGSIIEQLKIIDPLTNPTAYGASAADAFHVVIPSMPGYGFSGKPTSTGWGPERMGRAWAELVKLRDRVRAKVQKRPRALELVDRLFVNPYVNASNVAGFLGVTAPTARALIELLEREGILKEITRRSCACGSRRECSP